MQSSLLSARVAKELNSGLPWNTSSYRGAPPPSLSSKRSKCIENLQRLRTPPRENDRLQTRVDKHTLMCVNVQETVCQQLSWLPHVSVFKTSLITSLIEFIPEQISHRQAQIVAAFNLLSQPSFPPLFLPILLTKKEPSPR